MTNTEEQNQQSTYNVYVLCTNCLAHDQMTITKGILLSDVLCPNCGNKTLKNDPNGEIFSRPKKPTSFR